MNENLAKIKKELKEMAKELRLLKKERNEKLRKNDFYTFMVQDQVLNTKSKFRNMHVAYCLARGKNYSQIENKCRENNKIPKSLVENLLKQYELEAIGDING